MKIGEVMTREVEIVSPEDSIHTAARMLADSGIGALPAGENGKLVGMITDRDIVVRAVAEGASPETCKVRDVMSPRVDYVFDDEDVESAATKMAEAQIRRLLVLNRDKHLVGILSLGDLAFSGGKEHVARALEGVVQPTGKHEQTEIAAGR